MQTNEQRLIDLDECIDRLTALGDRVAVLTHTKPDGDAVGSSCALCLVLRALGKDAVVVIDDEISERLAFLSDGIEVLHDTGGRECVSIDVAAASQLGRLGSENISLMIDHHALSTPFAPCYTVRDASSAGEVLLGIIDGLSARGKSLLTADIAARLYAAMSSDTGGFIYSNAGAKTHREAARLIEYGIDFADINHRLFNSKSTEEIRADGVVASCIQTALGGRVAYALLPKEKRESLGLPLVCFDAVVDVVRALRGAEIAMFVRETDDGRIRASLRSTGPNVAEVAAEYNGGGHIRAAGCSPAYETVEEAARALIATIDERIYQCKENENEKDN